jgi:hypothetical protein
MASTPQRVEAIPSLAQHPDPSSADATELIRATTLWHLAAHLQADTPRAAVQTASGALSQ